MTKSGGAALGIAGADAVDQTGNPVGVLIVRVTPDSAAARAGIAPGDVITAINNQKVTSLAALQGVLAQLTLGTTATVTVVNQAGSTRAVRTVLSELQG